MKKLKNALKRIPRGVILGLNIIIIYMLLQFPCFTPSAAFHRALKNRGDAAADVELIMDLVEIDGLYSVQIRGENKNDISANDKWVFGGNERYVYLAMERKKNSWNGWETLVLRRYPAITDGVWCVPLSIYYALNCGYGDFDLFRYSEKAIYLGNDPLKMEREQQMFPCFAVKATGCNASLELVLDPWDRTIVSGPQRFPLVLQEAQNGWFVFGVDFADLVKHGEISQDPWHKYGYTRKYESSNPYCTLVYWLNERSNNDTSALGDYNHYTGHLEFTLYDESGAPVQSESWDLRDLEKGMFGSECFHWVVE